MSPFHQVLITIKKIVENDYLYENVVPTLVENDYFYEEVAPTFYQKSRDA